MITITRLTHHPSPSLSRYAHAKAKLYVVVFAIDGESLVSEECQLCLSLLAACASVSLIAGGYMSE